MSLNDWERDVINRQRNIVFPDTVLNEGRFYRNIASGKAVFSRGQKISLTVLALYFLFITLIALANFIVDLLAETKRHSPDALFSFVFISGNLAFWLYLVVKGLLSASPTSRNLRKGYRKQRRS
jgi:nucleoside permease NupC